MALEIGERKALHTCKRDRNSTWGDSASSPRKTSVGMKTVVTISKNSRGQKISTTTYEM